MKRLRNVRGVTALLLVLASATADSQFPETMPMEGIVRDVAVDALRGRLLVSRYDDGSVLRFDSATLALIDAMPAGRGASALAISVDQTTLACLNRLDETVSLFSLESGALIATTPVGKMPTDIAPLPGGGFAVCNSFSDSVTLINSSTGNADAELTGTAPVPSAIGASERFLAVASRSSNLVQIFESGNRLPARQVPFDASIVAVEGLPGDRFCVATADELILVDGASGGISARIPFSATTLKVSGARLLASTRDSVVLLDDGLRETYRSSFPAASGVAIGGGGLASVGGGLIGWEPAAYTAADPVPSAEGVTRVSSDAFAPVREPVTPEATAADLAASEPGQPETAAEAESIAELEPPAPSIAKDEIVDTALEPASTPMQERRPIYYPLRLSFLSRRAYAPVLGLGADEIFREQLRLSLATEGEHAGLLGLNWQRNPEPERFDSWIRRGSTDTFEGDVEFHVDDAVVNADRMVRDDVTGDIEMGGGVQVTRDSDSFRASYLQIRAPENLSKRLELSGIPIVPRGYRGARQYAYAGYVNASDVEWHEQYRDLTAERLETTLDEQDLAAARVRGRAGGLFFDAERLTISGQNSLLAEEAWISTCDHDPPHYTLNFKDAQLEDGVLQLRNARLKMWGISTPLVVPRFKYDTRKDERRYRPDLEFGSSSNIGTYANLGQWYSVSPYVDLGVRTMPTTKDGFGYGLDAVYDFRGDPRTPLFRSTGSLQSLHTTHERGYVDFRHQQDLSLKTRFVGQTQQWSDEEFLNDWFNDQYEDQNGPRTFANFTHTRPGHIMTLTASPSTHGFQRYSEKLPEATYHLLDRQIAKNLYFSLNSYAGYYELEPQAITTERAVNIARLSYDLQLAQALNILPFVEGDYSVYTDRISDEATEERFGATAGVTMQSRLTRTFAGIGPYKQLKHVVVPSVTYLYRPDPSGELSETPQLDGLDFRPGRNRVEGKIDNILLAKHAETGDIWQLAHVALYAGSDFESEIGTSDDIEVDFSFQPVPKWGLFTSAEHHSAEAGAGIPGGDFNRLLSYVFYDNASQSNTFNARLGYSYSDLDDPLRQNEVLYGTGVRLGKSWSVGFEHRLSLENNEVTRQTYEIRRLLHDWEFAVRVRDREDAVDLSLTFTLIDFPTASLKF